MTLQSQFRIFWERLCSIYPSREAAAIADLLFAHHTTLSRLDRLTNDQFRLDPSTMQSLNRDLDQLMDHRPVQYVIGEAWFMGLRFKVNDQVLIPRPETEELADWILSCYGLNSPLPSIIVDLGTGSGCLGIVLKIQMPGTKVYATDLSEGALAMARENAGFHGVDIEFVQMDMLDPARDLRLPPLDLIVSNPPYITPEEKQGMARHVVDYEPHLALFVPEDDPYVYYKAILRVAQTRMAPGGAIFMELNESLAPQIGSLFENQGFQVQVKKDMQGKDRMIRAQKA